jgi:Transposase
MEEARVDQFDVWIGLAVGKQDHHATALSPTGERLFERGVRNDERALEGLFERAAEHGQAALVIDQPGSIGALAIELARGHRIPVAYVPGLMMRRASELYPGEAKTDRRDSFVLADTARTHAHRLHWLEPSDELIEELRVLAGYDDDLAGDWTRTVNRLRDLLLSLAPALERILGPRLEHPAARAPLRRYPTPTALRGAKRGQLVRLAKRHAPRMGERLVDDVKQALAAQTITVPAERAGGRVIAELAQELDRLADRRQALEREIEALFRSHPQGAGPALNPGNRGQDRRQDPHRDR